LLDRKQMVRRVSSALCEYTMWKLRLQVALETGSYNVVASMTRCDRSCEFGQWLHGSEIDAETKAGMPYKVVRRLHAECHEAASRVLIQARADNMDRAQALLAGEFSERSDKFVRALMKWRGELMMRKQTRRMSPSLRRRHLARNILERGSRFVRGYH
jgi:hypothetical protein